jgi:hypothetical protein
MKEHIFRILRFGRGAYRDKESHRNNRGTQSFPQSHFHPPRSWWLPWVLILAILDL